LGATAVASLLRNEVKNCAAIVIKASWRNDLMEINHPACRLLRFSQGPAFDDGRQPCVLIVVKAD
jgi:hypothetical protein